MATPKFVTPLYRFAGLYGLVALLPQYFMETRTGVDFPPPITHPEFFYGFIGVATAWQIIFFFIAKNPVRFRPIMIGGILEKAAFGIAGLILFAGGRTSALIAGSAALDMLFAAAFAAAYFKTPDQSA